MNFFQPKQINAQELEIILSRQLADCLSVAIFLTDTAGNLLFYNEPAEQILGKKFEISGPMPVEEWSVIFRPQDEAGNGLKPDDLPLVRTLQTQKPAHGSFWIESLTRERHLLCVTSFPVIGRGNRYLGAIAVFWTNEQQ